MRTIPAIWPGWNAFVPICAIGVQSKITSRSIACFCARWRDPVTGKAKDDVYQHAIRELRKQREIEEGNRLFYVAMTRAEQHLVLSYSRTETAPKNWAALLEERWDGDVTRVTKPPDPL